MTVERSLFVFVALVSSPFLGMDDRYSDKYTYKKDDNPKYSVNKGYGDDEALPEVCIDNSPQALSNREVELNRRQFEDREPKYPVTYDNAPNEFVSSGGSLPSESMAASRKAPGAVVLEGKGKICGLRRRVFFVVLGIALIIMVAAVGGGVGGAMSTSKSKKATPVAASSETPSRQVTQRLAYQNKQ